MTTTKPVIVTMPCWLAQVLWRTTARWPRLWRGLILRCRHSDSYRDEAYLQLHRDDRGRIHP